MQAKILERKLNIFLALVLLIFLALFFRVAFLQLVQTEKYTMKAEDNRLRRVNISAPRGEIRDKNGIVLVKERPVYSVSLALVGIKETEPDLVIGKLAKILNMPKEEILALVKGQERKYEPIKIKKDVPPEVVTQIEERRMELPGVIIDVEPMRHYVKGDFAPHVLGYVREITEQQLAEHKDEKYKLGDRFGQAGLEKTFEKELRGVDGSHWVEVDANLRPVAEIGVEEPTPGNSLILTLDSKLQKAAEEALDRRMAEVRKEFPNAKAGAVVVMEVKTGRILAMSSKPGYDPNVFNFPIPTKVWKDNFSSDLPFPPLNNRALMGYPPGSTFKMVTATAALETKVVTPQTTVYDRGSYVLGDRAFKCWKPGGHGTVNLVKAIQVSCNVYFYTIGHKTGNVALAKYAHEYGLGNKTGVSLPSEQPGLIPTEEWKKSINEEPLKRKFQEKYKEIEDKYNDLIKKASSDREKRDLERKKQSQLRVWRSQEKLEYNWYVKWRPHETINMSIGQGDNLITPLQMAVYVASIADNGKRYTPYLVEKILDPAGKVLKKYNPEMAHKVQAAPDTFKYIQQGLRAVVQSGTARGIFSGFPVAVAGKTGTAQTGKDKYGKPKDSHGWFVGYAPYDNPEIVVAAIVEYGGHGGSSAGLVSKDVFAAYFGVKQNTANAGSNVEE